MNQSKPLPVRWPTLATLMSATPVIRPEPLLMLVGHLSARELALLATLRQSGVEVVLASPDGPVVEPPGIEHFLPKVLDLCAYEVAARPKPQQDKAWYRRFEHKPRYGR